MATSYVKSIVCNPKKYLSKQRHSIRGFALALSTIAALNTAIPKCSAQELQSQEPKTDSSQILLKIYINQLQDAPTPEQPIKEQHERFQKGQVFLDSWIVKPKLPNTLDAITLLPRINTRQTLPSPKLEARTSENISLEKTLRLTLQQNLQIAFVQQNIPIQRWTYIGTLGRFLPNMSISLDNSSNRNITPEPEVTNQSKLGLGSRFEYPLFQGGNVVFSSIANYALYQAAKGQYTATRNDALNSTIKSYYGLLADQAILRIRVESALFSAKQTSEYAKFFKENVERSAEQLNDWADDLDRLEGSETDRQRQLSFLIHRDLKDLIDITRTSSDSRLRDLSLKLANISAALQEEQAAEIENRNLLKLIRSLAGIALANERDKKTQMEVFFKTASQNDKFDLSQASPFKRLKESQLKQFDIATMTGRSAQRSKLKALSACVDILRIEMGKEFELTNSTVLSFVPLKDKLRAGAALQDLLDFELDSQRILGDLDNLANPKNAASRLNNLGADLSSAIVAIDIIDKLEKFPEKRDEAISALKTALKSICGQNDYIIEKHDAIRKAQRNLALKVNKATREGEPIQTSLAEKKSKSLFDAVYSKQNNAFAQSNKVKDWITDSQMVVNQKLDSAKQVAAFLERQRDLLQKEVDRCKQLIQKEANTAAAIRQIANTLLRLPRTEIAPDVLALTTKLKSDIDEWQQDGVFAKEFQNSITDNATEAIQAEKNQAGASFQLDQWNTQLGNDIQSILAQILKLRTDSISLAALLNIDPRVALFAEEAYLERKANDLSGIKLSQLITRAVSNRPELFQFDEQRKAAIARIGIAISTLLPTFTMFGEITGAGDSTKFGTTNLSRNYAIGYQAAYKFTNLLVPQAANVGAQTATALQAYVQFKQQLINILQQVHTSFINVQTIRLQIAAAYNTAKEATEQLVIADAPRERIIASASNIDVITALRDRNSAMENFANNLANYNSSQAQLLRDTGEIFPLTNYLK